MVCGADIAGNAMKSALALLAIAGILAMSGIISELIAVNRQLLEEIRIRQLQQEYGARARVRSFAMGSKIKKESVGGPI